MSLASYPGFGAFSPRLQALLLEAEAGEHERRAELLGAVADALGVLIGLDLLEFVFMPGGGDEAPESGTIDLIAPSEPEPAPIAWFSVDEAGHDEFRDAVSLFGDLTDVLSPPIVLDMDGDGDDGL
jgi:hypothetical protein